MKTYLISLVLLLVALAIIIFMGPISSPTGYFVFTEIAPEGFTYIPPEKISPEAASKALQEAYQEIEEMKKLNFTITFVSDVYSEAEASYKQSNYTNMFQMTQLISYIKKEKIEFLDRVELIKQKEQELQQEGIDISEGKVILEQAMNSFVQDQLAEAEQLLEQANRELDQAKQERSRLKELADLSKSFLIKYGWQIILIIIILGLLSYPAVKTIVKKRRKQKLEQLRTELNKTQELIKQLQKTCFVDKKMTTQTYQSKVAKYEERIAEIKHTIPVLEAQLKGQKAEPNKEKSKGVIEVKR